MTDQTRARPPRWAYLPFQISVTVAALLLFDQAIFAGQFLSGTFGSLHTHRENATFAGIAVLMATACAVFIRWPGQGPKWPPLACLGLFALIALQIVLGFARQLAVHVPLGVSIIMLAVLLVIWAWRPRTPVPATGAAQEIGAVQGSGAARGSGAVYGNGAVQGSGAAQESPVRR
jgi:heme A synthase